MKRLFSIGFSALLLVFTLGSARPATAADYPTVGNLQPFTAQCNYMSKAGYLRLLVYERDGMWLSRSEAVAIVQTQGTSAGE